MALLLNERLVTITARELGDLDKSWEVADFAYNNEAILNGYLAEYDQLREMFNLLQEDDPRMAEMPKALALKKAMGDTELPSLIEMADGHFYTALRKTKRLMLEGQEIARGKQVTPEEAQLAIGTPSYKTSPLARAVGTAAHLGERTFFEWAEKKGIVPQGGWKKDDWLHALKDVLILLECRSRNPLMRLTSLFLKSKDKDGLSWLTPKVLHSASVRFRKIYQQS
jgi:hypothetical protein